MGRRKKKKINIKSEETTTIFGVLAIGAAIVLLASLFVSNHYLDSLHEIVGVGAPFFAMLLVLFAVRMFGNSYRFNSSKVLISFTICLVAALGYIDLAYTANATDQISLISGGGKIGYIVGDIAQKVLHYQTAEIALVVLAILAFVFGFSVPVSKVFKLIKIITNFITKIIAEYIYPLLHKGAANASTYYQQKLDETKQKKQQQANQKQQEAANKPANPMMVGDMSGRNVLPAPMESANFPHTSEVTEHKAIVSDEQFSHWVYPNLDLLNKPKPYVAQDENVKKNSDIIEKTLESFGILAKVADVKIGPVVTQYALQITMGTKVAKINNLNRDLALALAASSGMVRVEAPIPGTSLVGIEMPNNHPRMVGMREIIEHDDMMKGMKLPVVIGRDVSGSVVIRDLQTMPHLLIAGSTGSGKSVTVNSFIISLLFKHSPNELKFIMVDPKQVELSQYNGIPHLLVPVITDMEKVVNALKWAIVEMENRYKRFKEVQVRNIEAYNQRNDVEHIPYIVIVIDEMADLMMIQGVEVENSIVRLAQMARAVGIHLLLATQRPSVNVITGLIKANIPARIGMSVVSVIDSRVILDSAGAETLLGKGDMLFKQPDSIRPMRVQGVRTEDDEIDRVLNFIKAQSPEPEYSEEITAFQSPQQASMNANGWEDSMFPDAVRVVVNAGRGSASILQSKLRIGYARAARLIEELEQKGVVGPQDGSKPRDVLITDAELFLGQQKADNENSR
jgi:DNA segregation ATPase FtsK/SpoIIIE-like protein